MHRRSLPGVILLTVLAAGVAHLLYYYPQLPDRVASHFDARGEPNGWSSKQSFAGIYAVMLVLLGGLFAGIAFSISRLPTSMINLPNKNYWLAPERREDTLATIAESLLWYASVTIAFVISIMHLTVRVNVADTGTLGPAFWGLFWAFLLYTVVWTVRLILRYRRVPAPRD